MLLLQGQSWQELHAGLELVLNSRVQFQVDVRVVLGGGEQQESAGKGGATAVERGPQSCPPPSAPLVRTSPHGEREKRNLEHVVRKGVRGNGDHVGAVAGRAVIVAGDEHRPVSNNALAALCEHKKIKLIQIEI